MAAPDPERQADVIRGECFEMQIRNLSHQDVDPAIGFLQAMVAEMASFGGHPTQDFNQTSNWFGNHIGSHIESPDYLFLIAEIAPSSSQPIGIHEASITGLHPVFLPRASLHIHSIYVALEHRRSGVARRLIEEAFEWGREKGCEEADLNALQRSPAMSLYRDLGFVAFQVEMRKRL